MNRLVAIFCSILLLAMSQLAAGDDIAAERARLANQRIQAEEQRRAREEAEQIQQEQSQQEQAQQEQVQQEAVKSDAQALPPTNRIEMSRALGQLRELGSLRDAGYLTDEEFQLLKNKILDGAL